MLVHVTYHCQAIFVSNYDKNKLHWELQLWCNVSDCTLMGLPLLTSIFRQQSLPPRSWAEPPHRRQSSLICRASALHTRSHGAEPLHQRQPGFIGQSLYTNVNKASWGRASTLTSTRLHLAESSHQRQPGFIEPNLHINANQAVHCSTCGLVGHNRTTCRRSHIWIFFVKYLCCVLYIKITITENNGQEVDNDDVLIKLPGLLNRGMLCGWKQGLLGLYRCMVVMLVIALYVNVSIFDYL